MQNAAKSSHCLGEALGTRVRAAACRVELFADQAVKDVIDIVHVFRERAAGGVILDVGEPVVIVPGVGRVRAAADRGLLSEIAFVVVGIVVRAVGGQNVVRAGRVAGV